MAPNSKDSPLHTFGVQVVVVQGGRIHRLSKSLDPWFRGTFLVRKSGGSRWVSEILMCFLAMIPSLNHLEVLTSFQQ